MLIDDEPDVLEAFTALLKTVGFDVAAYNNGPDGLKSIAARRPDVVLLDMLMPEPDGLETYQTLRANPDTRNIPVIFLTAMAVESHWERLPYDTDGPCFVMGKPYDPSIIVARITQVLSQQEHT